ncbi:murein L,D-transpeptidase [Sinorhizobium sp. BG8]|uniref:L,D-transpeptidase family protein n=1 Tax=Sinorhizobium sp. BG8 TaxID=2613773 RepID=UPI00193EB01F|nr:murein L,D-transpeptidase [Sinorhizobium sp. BG8]QRM55690.1 murein L,D-transpeptidase [Sinorhizobium sp. BG8]
MKFIRTAAMTALVVSCAMATLNAKPAEAAGFTLMDLLRGGKKKQLPPAETMPGVRGGAMFPSEQAESKPLPKVTGPRYYTYKADALKLIALGGLADPVVTGAIASVGQTSIAESPETEIRTHFVEANVSAPTDAAKAVQDYYGRNPRLIWVTESGLTERARAAIGVLADAASVGLDPADYAVELPSDSYDPADMASRYKALATFEIRLSAAVATYVQDAVRGRIDPNRISGYHDFARKKVNLGAVLDNSSRSNDVAAYLKSRSPSSSQFQALQAELQKLRAEAGESERIVIPEGTLLKPGQSNPELANVVKGILKHGSETLKAEHSATIAAYQGTPDYTPELVSLVEAFQKEHGLKPDGIVGKASIRLLTGGDSTEAKIAKVEIAMEQARWLPADLGSRHVFINQPAYTVYYHDNGEEKFSMPVVVGSKSNQTYFFQDEIQTVEFNPYWGVPQSIIINEMLPKLRSDPSYLDRMGYEVEIGGRTVSSSAVNWYGSTKSVVVRQPPSDDNALGELKILFPNSHAIYMHDTPSKSFFKRDMRALSHGCVRLSDPKRMAAAVLGTSIDKVNAEIAQGRNKGVSVPQRIPIYISYFTAWPNKDGVVEYFDDVYGRDDYMRKAFDATRSARHAQG